MATMNKEDAEEYTQALGQVVAGGWRQIALGQRLGVPQALGVTTEEWVNGRLGGYIKLSIEERRTAVKELQAEGVTKNREIARILGVDEGTVRNDLRPAENSAPVEQTQASFIPVDAENSAPLDVLTGLAADEAIRKEASKQDRQLEAKAKREEHLAEIAKGNNELSEALGTYPVIYADPPWQYEHIATENRAIENHYPTMALEELKQLPVLGVAADDCVLFLWATSPKLSEAMQLLEAWGFSYRTCMVWVKDKIGMGYYARQQHELLLIARRGEPPTPAPQDRPPSVFYAPRGSHSEKPEDVYGIIQRMYPGGRYLELFARSSREGWTVWGNQVGSGT